MTRQRRFIGIKRAWGGQRPGSDYCGDVLVIDVTNEVPCQLHMDIPSRWAARFRHARAGDRIKFTVFDRDEKGGLVLERDANGHIHRVRERLVRALVVDVVQHEEVA